MPIDIDDQPKKPNCTRCGKEIVGIIPKWDGEEPVCRECAFAGPVKVPFPRRRKPKNAPGMQPEDKKSNITTPLAIGVGAVLILVIGFLWTVPVLLGPMDHFDISYEGNVQLDRNGQECVANLMVMSKYLAKGAVSWPTRVCPATGKTYEVFREPGEVVIDCPNPGKHGLSRLWVSLKEPAVQAVN